MLKMLYLVSALIMYRNIYYVLIYTASSFAILFQPDVRVAGTQLFLNSVSPCRKVFALSQISNEFIGNLQKLASWGHVLIEDIGVILAPECRRTLV